MNGRRTSLTHAKANANTNLGLWLDRYLGTPKPEPNEDEKKEVALKRYDGCRSEVDKIRADVGYHAALIRRERSLRELNGGFDGGVTLVFTAQALGRVAVGLGQTSVWENNVSLSRTWGAPIIPGSALKGLASSYAARKGDEAWHKPSGTDGKKGDRQKLLFGDVEGAGEVTFHDAWWLPVDGPMVDRDVMTVHHSEYYSGTTDSAPAPADWDEPNPVSFFTTAGSFLLALSGPADAVSVATNILRSALEEDGVGAKTHAGYGRMTLESKLTVEEQQALKQREGEVKRIELRRRTLGELAQPMRPDRAPAELATRLLKLFSADYSEAEQQEVIGALLVSNKSALESWQKKDPARPGALLVRGMLNAVQNVGDQAVATTPSSKSVQEIVRTETVATLRVKGKDVFIEALGEGIPYKGGQKAANPVAEVKDAKQNVFLKRLVDGGNTTHRLPVSVGLVGDKIKTLEFLDAK